ncbi:MAG TPA: plastocyanin/azurin family copper-binding protein [Thermoleophilaceae bacterium]|jgi:plastocyanin|nr:plastocyanin/azurin family copper-binding protein [Thermoleophilaceae bacterium]
MRRALLPLVSLLLALPGAASAATLEVNAQFEQFGPAQLDALPGDTVQWQNVSERTHTVTADDGSFDSGDLESGGTFSRLFATAGTFAYHCTRHAGMVGVIDVRPVTLGALPAAAVPAGDRVEFAGRTADPAQPVRIERSTGAGFQTIATATAAADGSWKTNVGAQATGDYRAATDGGVSATRRLTVSDRKVLVRATRGGVAVSVAPALPYARIVLQQELRERFGWWTTKRARLDYVSAARFRVARPARVRVLLVDKDGWTALATSRVLTLGHVRRTRPAPRMPMHH